jgi:hypothetical protein
MTTFLKNDTEEGKNDPDPVNAGKKRPLSYMVLRETAPLLRYWFQRNFDSKRKTREIDATIRLVSLSWLKCTLKSILESLRGCLIPLTFQLP